MIFVSSCGLKKKSHCNSRVSLHEAPTNKSATVIVAFCRRRFEKARPFDPARYIRSKFDFVFGTVKLRIFSEEYS